MRRGSGRYRAASRGAAGAGRSSARDRSFAKAKHYIALAGFGREPARTRIIVPIIEVRRSAQPLPLRYRFRRAPRLRRLGGRAGCARGRDALPDPGSAGGRGAARAGIVAGGGRARSTGHLPISRDSAHRARRTGYRGADGVRPGKQREGKGHRHRLARIAEVVGSLSIPVSQIQTFLPDLPEVTSILYGVPHGSVT